MIYAKMYKNRVHNTVLSLDNYVRIPALRDRIKDDKLKRKLDDIGSEKTYFWDFGKRASQFLKPGSEFILVCSDRMYTGTISVLISDPDGEIGDCIGWARQYRKPWVNVAAISNLKIYSSLTKQQQQHLQSIICEKGNEIVKGFYELFDRSDVDRVCGTPDSNITPATKKQRTSILRKKAPCSEKPQIDIPAPIQKLVDRLVKMRNQDYSERDCESCVEQLFSYLGYSAPGNIRYRQGRVDILICTNDKPMMVIEVKKSMTLSRDDEDAVMQAYGYSLKNSSRYVVVTNGDYYAFFDREKGLSINENFQKELRLTKLSHRDLEFLENLRNISPDRHKTFQVSSF